MPKLMNRRHLSLGQATTCVLGIARCSTSPALPRDLGGLRPLPGRFMVIDQAMGV